ncbi:helix-turn-helix domain-containing protein [Ralstonia mannitolilytica]|uniref:helix-turn-helix domain-containing protein n=1 Tax=Ralstonia mannitolilytica TaxID=105219 RepID=UPI000CEE6BA2|nr:helix-turn-helix domain-containing protein [Ralstonia mannitolilytica]
MSESGTRTEAAAIGRRLKEARQLLGLSQQVLAEKIGSSKTGIQANEAGNSVPGGAVIIGLMKLGISANWLLMEQGPARLSDLAASSQLAPGQVDTDLLGLVIARLEKEISARGARPAPEKKAELIALLYDYMLETGKKEGPSVERILRLVA